jgi:protein O-GlcNAc transferase
MNNFNESLKEALELHKNKKLGEALEIYKKLLEIDNVNPKLLLFIGTLYLDNKNFKEAKKYLEKCIEVDKKNIFAVNNLAIGYEKIGQKDKAIELYQKSIQISDKNSDTFFRVGNLYSKNKEYKVAIENYEKAIAINPNFLFAYVNLANAQFEFKLYDVAINNYKKALSINKKFIPAYSNLFGAFKKIRKYNGAVKCCDEIIKIDNENINAYLDKGDILMLLKKYKNAIECYEKVIEINPNQKLALGKLLIAKMFIHDWVDYDLLKNKIINKIENNLDPIHPSMLLAILDQPKLHLKLSKNFTNKNLNSQSYKKEINVEKKSKINVGYFSTDFYDHATLRLMMNVFKYHDKNTFNFYGFYFGDIKEDFATKELKNYLNDFFYIENLNVEEIQSICREIKIDIAVDLKGLTLNNKINIFKNRIAPIQINYLGYPGTTGLKSMDYIIADKVIIPEENFKFYSEKVLHLPGCYQPNIKNRKISKLVKSKKNYGLNENKFTFCSFNNSYKITPNIFKIWLEILQETTNSQLWMIVSDVEGAKNLKKFTLDNGIDPQRIIFADFVNEKEHLNRIKLADVFLDTFPINAHTTASDVLRAGVPIITLKGESFASRVASSILHQCDMDDLITTSYTEYKNKAIELYNDNIKLSLIKKKLENITEKSSLFDSKIITKNLEKIYLEVYSKKI